VKRGQGLNIGVQDPVNLRWEAGPGGQRLDVANDLGEGHPLLGRRMPDLDLATADGTVGAPTAVLVRPDGHVAWVGDGTGAGLLRAAYNVVRR
jgi:hypothetical protein